MFRILNNEPKAQNFKSESGVITILFAIIVLMGVMVGVFALVVDGGQLMLERRVVQNVSDASALYLAQKCALNENCASNDATYYAQNNSPDLNTTISVICGSAPLPSCSPVSGDPKDCQSTPTGGSQFVRVRAQTQTVDGGSAILPAFAGILGGADVTDGTWTMRACSQVLWGKSDQVNVTLPLSISVCSYKTPTNSVNQELNQVDIQQFSPTNQQCSGTSSLDGIPLTGTDNGLAVVNIPGMDTACKQGTRVSVGDEVEYIEPGNNGELLAPVCSGLYARLSEAIGEQIYIPVFRDTSVADRKRKMTVISFARFEISGVKYGGVVAPRGSDVKTSSSSCSSLCIRGKFIRGVTPVGTISTDTSIPALGAMAVELIP